MTFNEDLQAHLVVYNKKVENEKKRLYELEEFMASIRIIRYECELIREYTCSDTVFLNSKKHVCDLISSILNNYYKCRNGQIEHIKKLDESIIVYNNYMTQINF